MHKIDYKNLDSQAYIWYSDLPKYLRKAGMIISPVLKTRPLPDGQLDCYGPVVDKRGNKTSPDLVATANPIYRRNTMDGLITSQGYTFEQAYEMLSRDTQQVMEMLP